MCDECRDSCHNLPAAPSLDDVHRHAAFYDARAKEYGKYPPGYESPYEKYVKWQREFDHKCIQGALWAMAAIVTSIAVGMARQSAFGAASVFSVIDVLLLLAIWGNAKP